MQQNKQEKQQQQTKKQSPPLQPQPQPMQPPQNQSRPLTTETETKIDLKTPSFIPVEKTRQNETDVDIPVSSPPNHAEVIVVIQSPTFGAMSGKLPSFFRWVGFLIFL